jgi:EAL domain-containing protein (putative c-di-GMP-specific phosphodiesterase class I)
VDAWVLERATAQLAEWIRALGNPGLVMTVNLSTRHVGLRRVVEDVRRALVLSGIPAQQLVLELSGTVLGDHHRAVRHLRELRDLGVAVSIDDFGSGFGALARLADLPVDIVKIDGRFLDVDSAMSRRLLHLMIQGAHAVGLVAVAQGVEQDRQLATLRALDCESVQGFHISRPMPAGEVTRFHQAQLDDRFSGLLP